MRDAVSVALKKKKEKKKKKREKKKRNPRQFAAPLRPHEDARSPQIPAVTKIPTSLFEKKKKLNTKKS